MTRLMTPLSCFMLVSIVCCSSAVETYEGRQDNKPVAELELMEGWELHSEMLDVCLSVGILGQRYGPRYRLDGIEYAKLITRVARKFGKNQQVMLALLSATAEGNAQGCERVNEARIEDLKRQKPRKPRNP